MTKPSLKVVRGKRGPKKGQGGRPPAVIDQEQFESLCAIDCTLEEVCAVLKVDHKTLNQWCESTYGGKTFSQVFPGFQAMGNASLRRRQFKLAMDGNVKMLIVLGQNRLGQVQRVKETTTTLHEKIVGAIHGQEEE